MAAHQLADEGDLATAEKLAAQLLNEDPHDPKALSVMAYVLMQQERFGEAYCLLQKANKLWPGRSEIMNNLGMCALGCLRLDEAERLLKDALKYDGGNTAAMNNLALVYVNQCEPAQAVQWGRKARAISGRWDANLEETMGYAYLMLGEWEEGWKGYEGGLNGKVRKPRSYTGEGYWDGRPVNTLVVRGEQGIGDEISFASVIPDAKKAAKHLIVECDRRLEGLFRRSFPDLEVHGTRFQRDLPWVEGRQVDAHVLSGSLCRYYRNRPEDFPGQPYLRADPERKMQWRALLQYMNGKKIGIAWTGGKHNTHAERRSVDVGLFEAFTGLGHTLVSLQYKAPNDADRAEMERLGIKHWARATEAADYDETAALVDELDVVITVQTAVVHLCGALGKRCFVLVPEKPHWRYGMAGDSMPWYRSVRLFRQRDGKWPIEQIVRELQWV